MTIIPDAGDALILVDVQNDFLPGGSLPVPSGNKIIPILNRYIALFHAHGLLIFATRDWHPPDHISFLQQGGPWPPHCIAETWGAAFAADLELPSDTFIISKATNRGKDAYSGFDDTPLNGLLKSLVIRRVFIGGVATEYCVLNTVKDALRYQYMSFVLQDAICALDINPNDSVRALAEMAHLGAIPIRFHVFDA
jgi:nicotinamidase/pyrazinamidase